MSRRPRQRPGPGREALPGGAERGATALEFAVLAVAFLLLVFLTVQAALYYHARNVVKAEAEGAARAVRAYPAEAGGQAQDQIPSPQQVRDLADTEARRQWQILDNSGDTTSEPQVEANIVDFNQVLVTVEARPILILPGIGNLTITASAGGPFEVFKRSGDD